MRPFPSPFRRLALIAALSAALPGTAPALDTAAQAVHLVDYQTGAVMLSKKADTPLPPASMSKLMTLYMLFEALKDGRVQMDTAFPVSTRAKNMGGSTMFLNELDRPTVEELILGIIVNSGNDACVVVAEGLAGSEEAFARRMTERARELGMDQTTLANSSGWPHPDHRMSMRDLAILTDHLIRDFPEYYPYFDRRENDYKNRSPANRLNRNPLFRLDIGSDGLKTGHTQEAGYGIVASAIQGERRVILVITGLDTERQRTEESERLITWAFRDFRNVPLFGAGETVAEAEVWLGESRTVPLVTAERVLATLPFDPSVPVAIRAVYDGPLEAPIEAGQQIGRLLIEVEGLAPVSAPLLAGQGVPRGGYLTRIEAAARTLLGRVAAQF
jgi:serine-type D-Ala-D-Ala carboxypeptidase (penicillin-binding protein 5/6)